MPPPAAAPRRIMSALALARVEDHAEDQPGRKRGDRRGERTLLDLLADLRGLALDLGRHLLLLAGARQAIAGKGTHIGRHLGEIVAQLLDVGLDRRQIGLRIDYGDDHRKASYAVDMLRTAQGNERFPFGRRDYPVST